MSSVLYRSLLLVLVLMSCRSAAAEPIPVEDFFRNPDFAAMQISPNGKYIATLAPIGGHRNIVVLETDNLRNAKQLTGHPDQDVAGLFWANDDIVVFTMDDDGNEAFGLYAVDRTRDRPSTKVRTLVEPEVNWRDIRFATVHSILPDDPDHIIVSWNQKRLTSSNLYKVNVRTGHRVILTENFENVSGWIVDHDGVPRGALIVNGLRGKFIYRDGEDEEYRTIREFDVLDEGISPLVFAFDNETMLVASNIGRDTNAVYTYDPATDTLGEQLFGHDEVDVTLPILSWHRKKLLGVSYFDDYPQVHYFDEEERRIQEGLKAAFPGKQVTVVSATRDETTSVLLVSSDRDPGSYYLFNRDTNQVRYIASRMSWLDPEAMVPMKPIAFEARDGLTIRGYLTLPADFDGSKPVPLIVNPHGGPFGVRDYWGFNPEHQFLANRGYAVVQVNYRGSGGYGRSFEHAGYGKWGREMQDDLTDAVQHLIDEGVADKDRVCIYGASYGGYATMAGLTFTPDVYRCGINYVGVTDVGLLFTSAPKHWELFKPVMEVQIGDPADREFMDAISPLAHVDRIDDPLLIVHGRRDPRVVIDHAEKLRKKLRAQEKTFYWFVKGDEGHGFRKEENRLELYAHIDRFLADYL